MKIEKSEYIPSKLSATSFYFQNKTTKQRVILKSNVQIKNIHSDKLTYKRTPIVPEIGIP